MRKIALFFLAICIFLVGVNALNVGENSNQERVISKKARRKRDWKRMDIEKEMKKRIKEYGIYKAPKISQVEGIILKKQLKEYKENK